jgi:4-amino-4-deoxy-L-arabinose transferase-like glycosyltransferase
MKHFDRYMVFLAIVLLIAFSLRTWGINYELPYIFHPDEPFSMGIILNMFKSGNLNPHFYDYPSLFFYINAFVYIPYYLIGKVLGIFASRADILAPISIIMGVSKAQLPSTVLLGRITTMIFGLATVIVTYLCGKHLTGKKRVGLLAALMTAVTLPNVNLSRFITPDIMTGFFVVTSFLGSVLVYQHGKTRYYLVAGISAGLAASTKYNGFLVFFPLILAHIFYNGKSALRNKNIYLGLVVGGLAFLAGTPFAVIDFPDFLAGLRYDNLHYALGHAGMEGDTLKYYLNYMWTSGGILYVLSIFGMIKGFYSRNREIILLSIYPILYFIFINRYIVRNDRTFLLLTPFLFLLATIFLDNLFIYISRLTSTTWRRATSFGLSGLLILTIGWPVSATVSDTLKLTSVDSRTTARTWIENNLPIGTKIALESYSPFIDPARFSVQGFVRIIDQDPEWYLENGFEYLVFSQGMYGRYYNQPESYPLEVELYNNFFTNLSLVKLFHDGNYEIRIYKFPDS